MEGDCEGCEYLLLWGNFVYFVENSLRGGCRDGKSVTHLYIQIPWKNMQIDEKTGV